MLPTVEPFKKILINSYRYLYAWLLLLIIIITSAIVIIHLISAIYNLFIVNGLTVSSSLHESIPSTPLPNVTTPTPNSQDQQSSVISIANDKITTAGVFAITVGVILGILVLLVIVATILGIFGFFQVTRIDKKLADIEKSRGEAGRIRTEVEIEVKRVNELRVEFEAGNTRVNGLLADSEANNTRIIELRTRFEGELENVTLQAARMEQEIKQLDKRIEEEGQKFIEASFYYSEGSKLYINGDNQHAIEFYLRALKLLPTSISILERIGRAYSNLHDIDNAVNYFNQVLAIDSENETLLRSLSLLYRSTEPEKAIKNLNGIVHKNPKAFEAWDFLGLCYRDQLVKNQELIKDQTLIDEAINAHERALALKKRPETEFYLGILLYYSPKGDKIRAKELLSSAYNGTLLQEHDLRIRQVWKILIHAGALIVNDDKIEALQVFESLIEYTTTKRIREGVQMHLRFLLEGTDHKEWLSDFYNAMR